MKKIFLLVFIVFSISSCTRKTEIKQWPQFRGLNGSGVAADDAKPPVTFSEKKLILNVNIPGGISSPVVWNEKLFITGFIDSTKELRTICLNRENGKTAAA